MMFDDLRRMTVALVLIIIGTSLVPSAAAQDRDERALSSIGAPELGEAMDALFAAFSQANPDMRKSPVWLHRTDSQSVGALMYELADIAPMIREFDRNELAPYDHQFRGDMMKSPVIVPIALRDGRPVWLAVNRRPGAPFAEDVRRFLNFVLGDAGQALIGKLESFSPLPAAMVRAERERLLGFVARVDPSIPEYRFSGQLRGEIRSVGSDGMKSLMERWMDEFAARHPLVRRGERWEHLGTLNGFHALLSGHTDLAPMGRELWPEEAAAYRAAVGLERPVEIKVARGGFNTPQRTTAQVIFVHPDNPVRQITLAQLRAIFGEHPTITRWGQLGAEGSWTDRPINIYMPPPASPNAMSMQISVLDGRGWDTSARPGSIAETANALAGDQAGIGFGGMEEGVPGLKTLAVAEATDRPAIAPDYEAVSTGRYPLSRYMYIRLTRKPGRALPSHQREFLRYILGRQGQNAIVASGYFPLTETELRAERAKLD